MKRKVVTIITAITGERVVVGKEEMEHALNEHYPILPEDMFLELLERILKEPSDVFLDTTKSHKQYKFFYRFENLKYIVAVIKIIDEGTFFASMYPTGLKIRNIHKKMKRIEI